jgi:predicted nucleic acid-binding protein
MKRVFLDTGVLLAAWKGQSPEAIKALHLLDDENLEVVSSALSELELFPQAEYHKQKAEAGFYQDYFDKSAHRVEVNEALVKAARAIATRHGLHAMDGLHVAVATAGGADEFITTEGPTKPIHRVKAPKVIWLMDV